MTQTSEHQIIIIGAGVAGLAAARRLQDAGLPPLVVEARDRIGGRIWTDRTRAPVELGAEFVHGKRAVTWEIIQAARLDTVPWSVARLLARDGKLVPPEHELPAQVARIYQSVERYDGPDRSVAEVLADLAGDDQVALEYALRWFANIEGADVTRLSARAIAQERAQNTAGWDNFHVVGGYDQVPAALAKGLSIRISTAVEKVLWDDDGATLALASGERLSARRVVVTVPLSLLKRGSPAFEPALPPAKQTAVNAIAMGHVTKLVLWFRRPFWKPFAPLTTDGAVVSWWPVGTPAMPGLMGYTGGPAALALAALGQEEAIARGLDELSALFGSVARDLFIEGRMAGWSQDPWSLGAYTYTPVGAGSARGDLAAPVGKTLFFAGEATSTNGHVATVHGAIESGWRAAQELLATLTC